MFGEFVKAFFKALNGRNVVYLIERNYERLPEYTSNDIDFLVADKYQKKFVSAAMDTAAQLRLDLILNSSAYGGGRLYFSAMSQNDSPIIRIDYTTNIHYGGITLLDAQTILKGREKRDCFYIPAFGSEAALSLMVPLIYTGKVKGKYKKSISEGALKDRQNFINSFKPYLADGDIENILNLVLQKKFQLLENNRKKLLAAYIRQNLICSAAGHLRFIASYFHRLRNQTGIFICLLGPDGSGKSTIIEHLSGQTKNLYPKGRFKKFHWRPGIFPQLRSLINTSGSLMEINPTQPYRAHKRGRISSFVRWLYYTFDYIAGYYLKILPLKVKTTLTIMDRYYYDIIVDPVRYNFNLPRWFLKSVLAFIPKPDLTIYLDNIPERLYDRKQELPLSEIKRQVHAWREFIPKLPNSRVVTTDKPLAEVVNEVTKIILETREEMTKATLNIDPKESFYLWESDLSGGYASLPSRKNCRLIIPANPILAEKCWDLYLPYSLKGRLLKSVLKFLSARGFLNVLRSQRITPKFSYESETLKKCIADIFKRDDLALAISTGTPGPFRKITAMVMDSNGKNLGFVKIAKTPLAVERIKNEANILWGLKFETSGTGSRVKAPECLYDGQINDAFILVQSPAPFEGRSGRSDFNEDYAEILNAFIKDTVVKKNFAESEFCKRLKNGIMKYSLSFRDLLMNALNYLEETICNKEITFSLSHGDFAPWNILWNGKKAFIFDWESANLKAPAGIDLIHFLFQTGFLLKKYRSHTLLSYIINNGNKYYEDLYSLWDVKLIGIKNILLLYLIYMAVTEDQPFQLATAAVARRNLITLLIADGK